MSTPQHGRVERIEWLTPHMVRLVLGGPGLDDFQPTPFSDQYVNVLVPPDDAPYSVPFDPAEAVASGHRPAGRRYTIRSWDPERREASIDFVVHGDTGVTGRWAQQASVGDLLQLDGPAGGWAPDPDADWYLMIGDESATPAIAASLEVLPPDRHALVVLVADDPEHHLALESPADLELHWVDRVDHGDPSAAVTTRVEDLRFPEGEVSGFVHGEAAETRQIRRHLLGDRGLDRTRLSISPYWRRGDTDDAWRQVKRDWLAAQELDLPGRPRDA